MASSLLLTVPQDILLKILYKLDVEEIIYLERTCRYLKGFITIEARHLWVVKLKELGQACVPDLPIDFDTNDLSCKKLREIICRSVPVYNAMIKGQSEETPLPFKLQKTIVPVYPSEIPRRGAIDLVRIAPGGRYLFMCWTDTNSTRFAWYPAFKFCILNLEASGQIVWSFDPTSQHVYTEGSGEVRKYDFEMCRDGSIILALVTTGVEDLGVDIASDSSISYLFKFNPDPSSGHGLQAILLTSFHHQHRRSKTEYNHITDLNCIGYCATAGDYAAFSSYNFSELIVVNWRENRLVKFRDLPTARYVLQFQILNDHLFYACATDHISLYAISLTQAMNFSSASFSETKMYDAGVLEISSIDLTMEIDIEHMNVMYSAYTSSFTDGQASKVAALIIFENRRLKAFRSSFDTSRSGPTQWSTGVEIYSSPTMDRTSLKDISKPPRSSRILCKLSYQKSDANGHYLGRVQKCVLLVLNRDGDMILVHLSNVPSTDEFLVEGYSDSDTLVILKNRGTGNDAIELYCPSMLVTASD